MTKAWLAVVAVALGLATQARAQAPPPSSSPPAGVFRAIAKPNWLGMPTGDDLAALYPAGARSMGVGGHVKMACKVREDGGLEACQIVSECPVGYGFAQATLEAARYFRMSKTSVDGQKTAGGVVLIPIRWWNPGSDVEASTRCAPMATITAPDWERTPTAFELAQAFPRKAVDKNINGAAVMQCAVTPQGALEECTIVEETPAGSGFGQATLSIARYFKMKRAPVDGHPPERAVVRIPIKWALTN
jgi:TonB family protein